MGRIEKFILITMGFILGILFFWYVVGVEIEGWITCDSQDITEKPLSGTICIQNIKEHAERGEPGFIAGYTAHLMNSGQTEVALPWVRKCVLEAGSCIDYALELCQKSVQGFDTNFIEQGFAIADRKTTGTADYADGFEKGYRAGLYAPCVPPK